jgi:beta-lactamase regulating signal transducer with metallopeptidase domain
MNIIIEHLNAWGAQAVTVGWQVLWQSSLLIAVMVTMDWALGRKLRPGVRYGLWLVVLLKLVLPPSLALPSGVAWWVRPQAENVRPVHRASAVVNYGPLAPVTSAPVFVAEPSKSVAAFSLAGGGLAAAAVVSLGLFAAMIWRWRQVAGQTTPGNGSAAPGWLADLLDDARKAAGVRQRVGICVVAGPMSPALFGLFRPVILVPESLIQRLTTCQLRAVLVHELIHLRRGDVRVNCVQTLLQIVYWWHPLMWVANHRIRRVREEAVDEAVMLALRGEAESYAPTLLEVARLALPRPLASLGLVGILESHGALRQRIERLVDFSPPRRGGVTLMAVLCAVVFGAAALPMGQAPAEVRDDLQPANQDLSQISTEDASGKAKKPETRVLLEDGKLLYEMGKLDEAEKKFVLALQQDPREQAAYYYLNLIKEQRNKNQRTGLRNTSSGRQRILGKLDALRLDRVQFDSVPLGEVVKTLAAESTRLDPAGVGINFIINQGSGDQNPYQVLEAVRVRVAQPLSNIRLADLLDAIVLTAEKPIKYAIEDYAVVFSFKVSEAPALYTRIIKVDPNTFKAALHSVTGKAETGDKLEPLEPLKLFREFLTSINVDLAPPKSIFWNDREGSVLVRATLQDLDTIETAIMVLNITPPQLNLKAHFIEVTEREETAFWERHPDAALSSPSVRAVQLRTKEAQDQLDVWKSNGSANVLSQPSITTLSGRQASIQVQEIKTIVTYTNSPEGHWVTNEVPIGPVLDVRPTLSADTLRVDLALTASMNEFVGYDEPGPNEPVGPVPHFRLAQLPVTASVWDGDTLVIGGGRRANDKPGDNMKRLLVMVTPTAIDPAGNRMHTDEEVQTSRNQNGLLTVPRAWRPTNPPRPVR